MCLSTLWRPKPPAPFGETCRDRGARLLLRREAFGYPPVKLQVYVGRTVRSSNQGQVRSIKWAHIHPDYTGKGRADIRNQSYDAAVIKLRSPVSGILPIKRHLKAE